MPILIFLISTALLTNLCQAISLGSDAGNGGYVLIYQNPAQGSPKIETYDRYEARVRFGIEFPARDSRKSALEIVTEALKPLAALDPERQTRYQKWAENIFSQEEALFVKNADLNSIGDIGFALLPKDATLKQAAVQREPIFDGDKRYFFDENLWNLMDNATQAELVTHEVIVRELGASNAQATSARARYFNALLNGDRLSRLNLKEYLDILAKVKAPYLKHHGLSFDVGSKITFHSPHQIKSGTLIAGASDSVKILGKSYPVSPGPTVLNCDGTVQALTIHGPFEFKSRFARLKVFHGKATPISSLPQNISFYPDSRILKKTFWDASGLHEADFKTPSVSGKNFKLESIAGEAEFYPSGRLKRFVPKFFDSYSGPIGTLEVDGVDHKIAHHLELTEFGELKSTCFVHPKTAPVSVDEKGCH